MREEVHWTQVACSDGNCVYGHPAGGMHTNGGCAHLKARGADVRRVIHGLSAKAKEAYAEGRRDAMDEVRAGLNNIAWSTVTSGNLRLLCLALIDQQPEEDSTDGD